MNVLPDAPGTLTSFSSVAGGGAHACGLTAAGVAMCWGSNDRGQLLDGSSDACCRSIPMPVASQLRFRLIAAGGSTTCGVSERGVAYCWGRDYATSRAITEPAQLHLPGDLMWDTLAVGATGACGISSDGDVYCWTSASNLLDVRLGHQRVSLERNAVAISAGDAHRCAIDDAGAAWCWGSNVEGQIGTGGRATQGTPFRVGGSTMYRSIAAGSKHTCAITTDGVMQCWGAPLGNASASRRLRPVEVPHPVRWVDVQAGSAFTCALDETHAQYCWGLNAQAQLGDGTRSNRISPTRVGGTTLFRALSTGRPGCSITVDGQTMCWGQNNSREVGTGRPEPALEPVRVYGTS